MTIPLKQAINKRNNNLAQPINHHNLANKKVTWWIISKWFSFLSKTNDLRVSEVSWQIIQKYAFNFHKSDNGYQRTWFSETRYAWSTSLWISLVRIVKSSRIRRGSTEYYCWVNWQQQGCCQFTTGELYVILRIIYSTWSWRNRYWTRWNLIKRGLSVLKFSVLPCHMCQWFNISPRLI